MRIAYQGEPGAYSEAAALHFSDHADLIACEAFDDVFTAVATGRATHGILPVENSIGGSIHRNYDLLMEHDLPIVGEVELPIRHHLLALPGTAIDQVQRIYSHPQALAQCERFLKGCPAVRVTPTYDTAGSAKLIKEQGLTDAAAIASERAAQVFGLDTLQSDIQDFSDNITRFLVIARSSRPAGARRQDDAGLLPEQRARRALQGAERVRAARHRPDEDRVAAHPRPALGVPVLRRHPDQPAGPALRARARAPRGVRPHAAHAGLVPERADARGGDEDGAGMSDTQFIRRSDVLLRGPHRAPARAMLKASGFDDEALGKPIIGVANTWIEIGPCNHHLRELAAAVKDGIRAAGGTPMEFNTVSINDGITMGTDGMRASLISREVIADSIELVARGYNFDGVIALCGCDKTIPGTTMAVARLGIPGLVLYGGSIAPGAFHGPRRHHPGRVRGRRRARGRPHERRGPARHRGPRLPGLRRLRRPVHREHDGHRHRVPRRRADGQRLGAGDCARRRPTSAGGPARS